MKIVCLSNSFREGGRCLGGVELDQDDNPVSHRNRPKWIRPVCNTEHHEVPTHLVSHINLLDIIEFDFNENVGSNHQTESVSFGKNSIKKIGRYEKSKLNLICENNTLQNIFGNRGKAIPEEAISYLTYSLLMICVEEFEVNKKTYEEKKYPQIRLAFRFKNILYDLPITDPFFLHQYQSNNNILDNFDKLYLSLSLAAPYKEWYYKLVAGILF